jgi:uncharacterized protein (TIGR02145 family)
MKKFKFLNKVKFISNWLLLATMVLVPLGAMAQVTVGSGNVPTEWSLLDIDTSVQKKGLHSPRLNNDAREKLISSETPNTPAQGVLIFNTDSKCLEYWNSQEWVSLCEGDVPPISDVCSSVIINGVEWACSNVDVPGTFATAPESTGKYYQWNRNTAWDTPEPAGLDYISYGDDAEFESEVWTAANDPSPDGWRIPVFEEFQSLLDEEKVSKEWVTQNAQQGLRFTDKTTGNSLFLPVTDNYGGGIYWTGRMYDEKTDNLVYFASDYELGRIDDLHSGVASIRPVKGNAPAAPACAGCAE